MIDNNCLAPYNNDHLFVTYMKALTQLIDGLKLAGHEIHDDDDFGYVVDYIYYSPASKKICVKFKEGTDK
jgi:hypothetical protein